MPDCNSCRDQRRDPVPYMVFEDEMARQERHVKRLLAIVIILAVLLAGTVAGFLIYLDQYDFVGYSQDGSGTNIVAGFGNRNEVNYHGAEDKSEAAEESLPGEGSGGPQS